MDQLLPRSSKLDFPKHHMDRVSWAKRWLHITQRWPRVSAGPTLFLSLYQAKVKVGFWPSVAKRSKGRCFISTKVNTRHSQATKWSITDNFSINQNHRGPFQTYLTEIEKIQEFENWKSEWSTYRGRHPVWYVYETLRVLGNALGVQGSRWGIQKSPWKVKSDI